MFCCIVAGRSTQIAIKVEETKYLIDLQDPQQIKHLVAFLTEPLAYGCVAGVYLFYSEWKLLGYLSNDKPSAIYKLENTADLMEDKVQLGFSLEPASAVPSNTMGGQLKPSGSMMLILQEKPLDVAVKLLQHFYNYCTSFSVQLSGQGYLPIKVFTDWYETLNRRILQDPTFLR